MLVNTRDINSTRGTSSKHHHPGETYRRRLRSLLLYLCCILRALINSLVCWFGSYRFSEHTAVLQPPDWVDLIDRQPSAKRSSPQVPRWWQHELPLWNTVLPLKLSTLSSTTRNLPTEVVYLVKYYRNLPTEVVYLVRYYRNLPTEVVYLVKYYRNLPTEVVYLVRYYKKSP